MPQNTCFRLSHLNDGKKKNRSWDYVQSQVGFFLCLTLLSARYEYLRVIGKKNTHMLSDFCIHIILNLNSSWNLNFQNNSDPKKIFILYLAGVLV